MANKTLYHSELKGMGPVRVTVKGEVKKSKYQGKPDYVTLAIGNEERTYNAENPACADFFRGKAGQTFTISAEGGGKGQEDTATITFVGGTVEQAQQQRGAPVQSGAKPAAATQQRASEPAGKPASMDSVAAVTAAVIQLSRMGTALELGADQTLRRVELWSARHGLTITPDMHQHFVQTIATNMCNTSFTTFMINLKETGIVMNLPLKDVGGAIEAAKAAKSEKKAAAPKPEPKRCAKCAGVLAEDGSCAACVAAEAAAAESNPF